MLLNILHDEQLGQMSYFLASPVGGVAIVIDPTRDIAPYMRLARAHNVHIIATLETHIHADFISGVRELAHRTGATIYLSAQGQYDFPERDKVIPVNAGDRILIGSVQLDVLHTPGHTPEHLSLRVSDARLGVPVGVFTGDTLLVGDAARPDLAQRPPVTDAAQQMYHTMTQFMALPDYLQIWPGHQTGYTLHQGGCDRTWSQLPASTLGYEKLTNPALQCPDEAAFTAWLSAAPPRVPRYYATIKALNRNGAPLLSTFKSPSRSTAHALHQALSSGALVIDARPAAAYAHNHLKGTLHIPGDSRQFVRWAGEFIHYDKPTFLIADENDTERLITALRTIGVDYLPNTFSPDLIPENSASIVPITPLDAEQMLHDGEAVMLDVRERGERAAFSVANTICIPLTELLEKMDTLPADKPVITLCDEGTRALIAASLLEKYGHTVMTLMGGIAGWERADLPVERG
ncbi:MAG: MBL fold metallo-hydrolase [Anaerolineae bacterium]